MLQLRCGYFDRSRRQGENGPDGAYSTNAGAGTKTAVAEVHISNISTRIDSGFGVTPDFLYVVIGLSLPSFVSNDIISVATFALGINYGGLSFGRCNWFRALPKRHTI